MSYLIADEDLTRKSILEIGTGRGGTTRELVELAARFSGAVLVTTDISDRSFSSLKEEFKDKPVKVQFIQTSATALDGIANSSMDHIVCNYTLCAINTFPGQARKALQRFFEVLKVGGSLYIEEEFPIDTARNPA